MSHCSPIVLAGLVFAVLAAPGPRLMLAAEAEAAPPLHVQIDRLIAEKAGDLPLAPRSGDAEFVRRAYLDLAGRIPTFEETRAFLADTTADKRTELIDRLLASPEYPRRMQELFHAMLMERRGENEEWAKFLRIAFERDLPWHRIAAAVLNPDADDAQLRGAAYFLTGRLVSEGAMAPVDVPGLTRDVGRLFAGIDLQCAQCHDHLTIPHYHQQHFQGLHVIFENIKGRRDVKFPAVSEMVMTEKKEFVSVFGGDAQLTGLVIPGRGEVQIAVFDKGEEFAIPPDNKTRFPGKPKFSPLAELADGLASPANTLFARNIANRMWFVMQGRGLVEPLDLIHADNPPSHPELLDLLARELAAHEYDLRWLLRELALTDTWQRTSVLAEGQEPPPAGSYAVALEKRMSPEQFFWSLGTATGEFDVRRAEVAAKAQPDRAAGKGAGQATAAAREPVIAARPAYRTGLEALVAASKPLQELRTTIIKTFANPPKEPEVDFTPTVKGALFLMHDASVQQLVARRPGNLVDRAADAEDNAAAVQMLFLSVLSRPPSAEEQAALVDYLTRNTDRRDEALGNAAWALLTSTEFVVNH